jgi:farnesyl-diphosphate farnesyltransferase
VLQPRAAPNPTASDHILQGDLLTRVSRTFALTIPQLPPQLRTVVTNAYLLCRSVDTIEDEPCLSASEKRRFCAQFAAVVAGKSAAAAFVGVLAPRLSAATPAAEQTLIREIPRVIGITHAFNAAQQEALRVCVQVMAEGMAAFQEAPTGCGLANLAELDRYCYYVAGVVGEMLTRLFCDYSPAIAKHREALMPLAVSFGQGLQMTNILKDIWEDRGRPRRPRARRALPGFRTRARAPRGDRARAPAERAALYVAHPETRDAYPSLLFVGDRNGAAHAGQDQTQSGFQ